MLKKELLKELKKKDQVLKKNKNYLSFFFEDLVNRISNKYILQAYDVKKLKFVEIDFKDDLDQAKVEFKNILSKI